MVAFTVLSASPTRSPSPAITQLLWKDKADGQLIELDGVVVGAS